MNSQTVRTMPTTTTKPRSTFSGNRCSSHAPAKPPAMPPMPSATTAAQFTSGENTNTATADAFIVIASTFLVAPAMRTCWPATVSAASIRKPMPPPK